MKTDLNQIKLGYLFFMFSVIYSQLHSQDYYGNHLNSNNYVASQVIGNPTVQPPDVAAFQKVSFIPVSNYTGRANINIPIYSISEGSMSVPVSLSYNSSGVKVSDMASSVGLNWSLNAGGMISRIIKGMDDFKMSDVVASSDTGTPSGWLGFLNPNYQVTNVNRYNDAEPDIFSVTAPGISTSYIHQRNYSNPNSNGIVNVYNYIPQPIELKKKANIINETIGLVTLNCLNDYTGNYSDIIVFGLQNVDITSTDGIVYSFSTPDLSRHLGGGGGPSAQIYKIESYRLDRMFDPGSNQSIDFEYEQYSNYFYDPLVSKNYPYGGGTNLSFGDPIKKLTYPVTQRLTKIIFSKGSVEFIYDLNRLDNEGDKALTEIKIKDHNGNIVKHVKLQHSYFQSTIASSTPQSKRLRLDKVYEVDNNLNELPGHIFTYDTTYEMPPRDSYAHDFLGYNNGSYNVSNSNPIPKYYVKANYTSFSLSPFYDSAAIQLTGNYSLEANSNYCKAYSLKKIKFPTGGENEYEYELNEFSYNGLKQGAGLRIKSQTINDGKGNQQILDYEYSNGSIVKMPNFAVYSLVNGILGNPTTLTELTSKLRIDTFSSPQSQVEFTQGAFVGYGSVKIKDRVNNGYKSFGYSAPYPYQDNPSTKTYDAQHSYSSTWSYIGPPSLSFSNDYLRGTLLTEAIYGADGKMRTLTSYQYSQKTFSSINLKYLNKSSGNSSNCYNSGGMYTINESNCGGYTEELNFPVVRNVLSKITINDYQKSFSTSQSFTEQLKNTQQTQQTYFYDEQLPLLVKEAKTIRICEEKAQGGQACVDVVNEYGNYEITKNITYPILGGETEQQGNTISSLPYASDLVNLNRISTPLKIQYTGMNILNEEHVYKSFSGKIGLEKVNFVDRENITIPSEIITQRDTKNRITEYQQKNGTIVSNIYGYDDKYMVLEVLNASRSSVITALSSLSVTYNSQTIYYDQETMNDSGKMIAFFKGLRNVLPEAMITSYTYNPLIGTTSVTDARGYTNYYEFDNFKRLKFSKDADGNLLSEQKYHYKNQ